MSDFAIKETPQTPIETAQKLLTPTEIESGAKVLIPDHNIEGFVASDGGIPDPIVESSAATVNSELNHNAAKAGALHSFERSSSTSAQNSGSEKLSPAQTEEPSLMPRIKELSIGWKHQSAIGDYVQQRMIKAWMSRESIRLGMGEITEKKQVSDVVPGDMTAAQAVADMDTAESPPSASGDKSQGEMSGVPERSQDAENPDPTSLNQEAADLESEAATGSDVTVESSNIESEDIKADDTIVSSVTTPETDPVEADESNIAPTVMTETSALMSTAKWQLTGTMSEVGFASGVTQAPEIAAVAPGLPAETELPHMDVETVADTGAPQSPPQGASQDAPISLDQNKTQKAGAAQLQDSVERSTIEPPKKPSRLRSFFNSFFAGSVEQPESQVSQVKQATPVAPTPLQTEVQNQNVVPIQMQQEPEKKAA